MSRTKLPPIPDTPEGRLEESRRLTDKLAATRREWEAGKGKDYGTALDFIISKRRRDIIVAQLRGSFSLAVDNTA